MVRQPRKGTRNGTKAAQAGAPIAAAEFKATCLELMDRVRERGVEYVVTKHGRPVAKLVPYDAARPGSIFGSMKGTVLTYDRPFEPLDAEWDLDRA
jgi:prevent-host-death family protein